MLSGGLDKVALRMLEDRAYAYFHWMNSTAPDADWQSRIELNYTTAGISRPRPCKSGWVTYVA